jgi:hypothetical protein
VIRNRLVAEGGVDIAASGGSDQQQPDCDDRKRSHPALRIRPLFVYFAVRVAKGFAFPRDFESLSPSWKIAVGCSLSRRQCSNKQQAVDTAPCLYRSGLLPGPVLNRLRQACPERSEGSAVWISSLPARPALKHRRVRNCSRQPQDAGNSGGVAWENAKRFPVVRPGAHVGTLWVLLHCRRLARRAMQALADPCLVGPSSSRQRSRTSPGLNPAFPGASALATMRVPSKRAASTRARTASVL